MLAVRRTHSSCHSRRRLGPAVFFYDNSAARVVNPRDDGSRGIRSVARIVPRRLIETWTFHALLGGLGTSAWICTHEDATSISRWPDGLAKWFIVKPTVPERAASAGAQARSSGLIDSYVRIDLATAAAHEAGFRGLRHPDVIYVIPDLSQWPAAGGDTRTQPGAVPPAVAHFLNHSVAIGASRLRSQLHDSKGASTAKLQFHRGRLMYRPHATQDPVTLKAEPFAQLLKQMIDCQEPAGLALRSRTRGQPRHLLDDSDTMHTHDMRLTPEDIDLAIRTVAHSGPGQMIFVGQRHRRPRSGVSERS